MKNNVLQYMKRRSDQSHTHTLEHSHVREQKIRTIWHSISKDFQQWLSLSLESHSYTHGSFAVLHSNILSSHCPGPRLDAPKIIRIESFPKSQKIQILHKISHLWSHSFLNHLQTGFLILLFPWASIHRMQSIPNKQTFREQPNSMKDARISFAVFKHFLSNQMLSKMHSSLAVCKHLSSNPMLSKMHAALLLFSRKTSCSCLCPQLRLNELRFQESKRSLDLTGTSGTLAQGSLAHLQSSWSSIVLNCNATQWKLFKEIASRALPILRISSNSALWLCSRSLDRRLARLLCVFF